MKENGGAACHDVAPPMVMEEKVQEVQVLPGCDGIAAYGTVVHLQAAMASQHTGQWCKRCK